MLLFNSPVSSSTLNIHYFISLQNSSTRISDRTPAVLHGRKTNPDVDTGRYLQILPKLKLVDTLFYLHYLLSFIDHERLCSVCKLTVGPLSGFKLYSYVFLLKTSLCCIMLLLLLLLFSYFNTTFKRMW